MKISNLLFLVMIVFTSSGKLPAQSFSGGQAKEGVRYFSELNGMKEERGKFIVVKAAGGTEYRMFSAGPDNAEAGVLFVHDYFGLSAAAEQSVERLGALGYKVLCVDLYEGKTANNDEEASSLLKGKDSLKTSLQLDAAIQYLKNTTKKLATVGFSAGAVDAVRVTLTHPNQFAAAVVVYGGDYDKLDKSKLQLLNTPILAITGSLDIWPMSTAINFLQNINNKILELHVYPNADHGYVQPMFKNGKNYCLEATEFTWNIVADYLRRRLANL